TVFVNLTVAVPVGLLLAMVSFVRRVSQVLEVKNISPDNYVDDLPDDQNVCPKIASFTIRGPLFFGAADQFETTLSQSIHKQPSVLILIIHNVSIIDVKEKTKLDTLVKKFLKCGDIVMITELNNDVVEMMKRSRLYETIGAEYFFDNTTNAINKALDLISTK